MGPVTALAAEICKTVRVLVARAPTMKIHTTTDTLSVGLRGDQTLTTEDKVDITMLEEALREADLEAQAGEAAMVGFSNRCVEMMTMIH